MILNYHLLIQFFLSCRWRRFVRRSACESRKPHVLWQKNGAEIPYLNGEMVGTALKLQSDDLKAKFLELKEMIHNHLGRKEAILMPKIRKMKADPDQNMKEIMKVEILSLVVDSPDFKFFIQHANHHLDKHGKNKPKARLFDHALWYCATGPQWKNWQRWIRGSVRKQTFSEIVSAISF